MGAFELLLSNAVMAAGLALVAALVGRVTTRPQITHALWVLVLVKLVTPPAVHLPVGHWVFGAEEAVVAERDAVGANGAVSTGTSANPAGATILGGGEGPGQWNPQPEPALGSHSAENISVGVAGQAASSLSKSVPWAALLIGIWGAGSLLWFVLAGLRIWRFKGLLRDAQSASESLQEEIRQVAWRYGLQRLPRVLVVDAEVPPMLCSFGRRACMVLPNRLLDVLGPDERAGLLAHELAHLRRYDHWIRWLELLVLGVHWWNPIAWWARANVHQAEEECSDAWVLWAFPNKACQYAQTLIDTIDFLAGSTRAKPEIATAFNQGYSLKRRIEMIVGEKVSRSLSWRARIALVLFAAVVVPLSLQGAPSDVVEGDSQGVSADSGTESPSQAATTEEATTAATVSGEHRAIRGRVVAPDGRPVAGATVLVRTYFASDPPRKPVPETTTDANGAFRIDVPATDLRFANVVAHAEGFAFGLGNGLADGELTIRLAADGPAIRGRIVDTEGRPIGGADVSVAMVSAPVGKDLSAWVDALKTGKEAYALRNQYLRMVAAPPFPALTTNADGRFALKGIGAERIAALRVDSPVIETTIVDVMTRPGDRVALPFYRDAPSLGTSVYYGAEFEHRVRRVKPIVGTVRDKDSGEALAGVRLRAEPSLIAGGMVKWVETSSDAEGNYRLTGVPRTERTEVLAIAPDDQPYMLSQLKVKDMEGEDETKLDFALKRGLWIEGQVTDKATGEPVKDAAIFYYVFRDNPNAKEAPGLSGATRGWIDAYYMSSDGSFRRVGLPGRGLIAVRVTAHNNPYRFGVGTDEIEGGIAMQGNTMFKTLPSMCNSGSHNALFQVTPGEDQDRYECNVELDAGNIVMGTILDPEGKPLTGAYVWGSEDFGPWDHDRLEGSRFEAKGYDPAKPRYMFFLHKERQLAGHLILQGEQSDDLTVRLQPWASISGRIVDAKGRPKGGLMIRSGPSPKKGPDTDDPGGPLPRRDDHSQGRHYTGDDGRFEIEGLVPGVEYYVDAYDKPTRTFAVILVDAVLKPGEKRDVGDVPLEDAEVLRQRFLKEYGNPSE